jgi:flagellar protein FlbB
MKYWGRVLVLLLLILALAAGGLVWFDYLGVIDIKTLAAPVYRLLGIESRTQTPGGAAAMDNAPLDLDAERLAVRLEAMDMHEQELDKTETDLASRRGELEQIAQELEEQRTSLDEREKAIDAMTETAANYAKNVEQNARYLNSMPPDNAVAIITAWDDQFAIDVLRKVEEIAAASNSTSLVSVWLSRLQPARAAEIQRKMAARP